MGSIEGIGRLLIVTGIVITAVGLLLVLSGKFSWLGRLPGDFMIEKRGFTLYLPISTSILISILLSLVFWLISRR